MNELRIVVIGLILGELLGLCLFFYLLMQSYKARNWIQHKGLVIFSNIEKLTNISSPVSYRNKIRYKYAVDSRNYESSNIYFGWHLWHSFPFAAWTIDEKYHVNDEVIIFYNPKNPSQAVIERNPRFIVFIIFFVILVLLGIILLICRIENITLLSLFNFGCA